LDREQIIESDPTRHLGPDAVAHAGDDFGAVLRGVDVDAVLLAKNLILTSPYRIVPEQLNPCHFRLSPVLAA
jgi:hypothetical protein